MEWLKGKKTYLASFLGAVVCALWGAMRAGLLPTLKSVPTETWVAVLGALGFGVGASLRAGVAKDEEATRFRNLKDKAKVLLLIGTLCIAAGCDAEIPCDRASTISFDKTVSEKSVCRAVCVKSERKKGKTCAQQ